MSRLSHRACRRSRRGPRSAEWFRQTLAVHSQLWKKEMAADWDVSDELLRRIKQLLPWALTSLLSLPFNAVGNEHARAKRCGRPRGMTGMAAPFTTTPPRPLAADLPVSRTVPEAPLPPPSRSPCPPEPQRAWSAPPRPGHQCCHRARCCGLRHRGREGGVGGPEQIGDTHGSSWRGMRSPDGLLSPVRDGRSQRPFLSAVPRTPPTARSLP